MKEDQQIVPRFALPKSREEHDLWVETHFRPFLEKVDAKELPTEVRNLTLALMDAYSMKTKEWVEALVQNNTDKKFAEMVTAHTLLGVIDSENIETLMLFFVYWHSYGLYHSRNVALELKNYRRRLESQLLVTLYTACQNGFITGESSHNIEEWWKDSQKETRKTKGCIFGLIIVVVVIVGLIIWAITAILS